MKKVLLLVLGAYCLVTANAQIVPVDGEKFRVLTDFKASKPFGKDTIVGISVTADTTGGLLIRTKQDTTAMYLHNDTAKMFTTASNWLFTPSLPCCTPDTVPLNFITTQCTTVTANKWRPIITDSVGRVSTTLCDTISYLYVDTLGYNYNDGLPYYVYTALLTQTDTFPPTAVVLQNTIGAINWIYDSSGIYNAQCVGCFPVGKTGGFFTAESSRVWVHRINDDLVELAVDNNLAIPAETLIEIRVYK